MLEFVLGMIACEIVRQCYLLVHLHPLKRPKIFAAVCLGGAIIVLSILATTSKVSVVSGLQRFFFWGILSAGVVILFLLAGLFLKFPRWMTRLGDISFSLYLLHYYSIQFFDRFVFDFSVLTVRSAVGAVIVVAGTLVLSYLTWLWIEKRLGRILNAWICRKKVWA